MKKMKKTIFVLLALLLSAATSINAQVTIGSDDTPATSAVLDLSTVEAQNLGLLLPQVPLTGTTDETTIPHPGSAHLPAGLMVYATGDGGLTAGVYVWDGGKWNTVAPAGGTVGDGGMSVVGLDGHRYFPTEQSFFDYELPYSCSAGSSPATLSQVAYNVPPNIFMTWDPSWPLRVVEPNGYLLNVAGDMRLGGGLMSYCTDYDSGNSSKGVCREN
jgi:hypothetical protein